LYITYIFYKPQQGGNNITYNLYVKTDSPGLSYCTPHHTILHLFVIPTADYAAKLLLRMGKGMPETCRVSRLKTQIL
jgi:hypothetical protein